MKATNVMAAALFGLLLFASPAAADGEPQDGPKGEQKDCPSVDVLMYWPYVFPNLDCIIPPGQG